MSLSSHDNELGSYTASGGLSSSSHPIFHSDEDIMEAMTVPDFPWEDMHHRAYFLPQQSHDQYSVETKDFIPDEVDWFRNPIPAPNTFEGNMANISPTIKINISDKPRVEENITLGAQCTPEEFEAYTKLFK